MLITRPNGKTFTLPEDPSSATILANEAQTRPGRYEVSYGEKTFEFVTPYRSAHVLACYIQALLELP